MRVLTSVLVIIIAQAAAASTRSGAGQCNPTPTPLPRSATYCGAVGNIKAPGLLSRSTQSSVNSCYAACLNDAQCVSFGFNIKNKRCRLFTKRIEDQDFCPESSSSIEFWDLQGCFDLACLTTKSSVAATAKASPVSATKISSRLTSIARTSSEAASSSTKIPTTTATATTSRAATPTCSNIIINPSFDGPSNDPWVFDSTFPNDPANAQSPPKYVYVISCPIAAVQTALT